MFIFDAHLDLSMNAMEWNRDLTRPIAELRKREAGMTDRQDRGNGTVSFEEMRRGRVGLCVATQIARVVKPGNPLPGWHSPAQAWAQTQAQLAWYRAMEDAGHMVQITDAARLNQHVALWMNDPPPDAPIGYILSLEGADSILSPRHLERAYARGLRALGPAHYGPGTYAHGTDGAGGLGTRGRELLEEMDRLGMILDATHLCDESFWEALDHFDGPVWASHQNCRAIVPHNRQFSDEQIKALLERGAVLGGVLDAWMIRPGWVLGPGWMRKDGGACADRLVQNCTPESVGVYLRHVVDHMEHICELAGSARHCGIGSDLDGEFGREQSPADFDTIADLQHFPELLAGRGFTAEDIAGIMHGNFLRFLNEAWA